MIMHKLVSRMVTHGDDFYFYLIQANDSIQWLYKKGIVLDKATHVLDLGCGLGIFGNEFSKIGCRVQFADEDYSLLPEIQDPDFKKVNIDKDDLGSIGEYDVVICSNVLEHLAHPERLIAAIDKLLVKGGAFYLSWTNWLSPWGGHEFSPFHYLGPRHGHRVFDKLTGRSRKHIPSVNLFPTSITQTLSLIRRQPQIRLFAACTRYYPEFSFILRIPLLREILAWNCALLIVK
jgi:SAM-dependent methyltransferase